ncbi:MAG: F0F1 ATP synthase subunit A [Candidatus Roizmanbacteria bacterium]
MTEAKHSPHISIRAEELFHIGTFPITNSLIAGSIVTIILMLGVFYYNYLVQTGKKNGFYYIINLIMNALVGLFQPILGKHMDVFFPWVGSFFFFILLQNWFGLLPGVNSVMITLQEGEKAPLLRGATADLNMTVALSLVAVILVQFYGIKILGFKEYMGKFLNFSNPLNFVIGLLEIISEFSRILSYSFRLFGNIFAGEVLLAIMAFLFPFGLTLPFFFMEIFVGFIQAIVFAMLVAVFINLAIQKHH